MLVRHFRAHALSRRTLTLVSSLILSRSFTLVHEIDFSKIAPKTLETNFLGLSPFFFFFYFFIFFFSLVLFFAKFLTLNLSVAALRTNNPESETSETFYRGETQAIVRFNAKS